MSAATVHLGFELGTGNPVSIPMMHTVITGQTQSAGKTTALEALIGRSGVKSVAFITKRGEGSFAEARIIRPYFRERTDWKFVAAILEASRGEKLKFERPWIIRASKGARTLADVHRNVRKAMETAKGLAGDIYLTLDAYLEDVVPQIGRVRWAERVDLQPGVNAMDLVALSDEMQQLVIRSTIEWVAQHEEGTVVVVPEAWKFIPQGRGSPVKLEAESYIRQGAGLGNYLWLDSQDIAGVEKLILKSVPVWILGVQRESNEVKRTLAQIPAGIKKPTTEAVSTLGLGEFYACHGTHITKVYAQPLWMSASEAEAIAAGRMDRPAGPPRTQRPPPSEDTVTEQEARELREENTQLKARIAKLENQIEQFLNKAPSSNAKAVASAPRSGRRTENGDAGSTPAGATSSQVVGAIAPSDPLQSLVDPDENLYQAIKRRLMVEAPALVKMLTVKPEMEVAVTRKTIQLDEFSLKGRIAKLLQNGFFAEARGNSAVRYALKRTGPDANTANIGRALDDFTRDGFVTDEGSGYREVAGMKVNIVEA